MGEVIFDISLAVLNLKLCSGVFKMMSMLFIFYMHMTSRGTPSDLLSLVALFLLLPCAHQYVCLFLLLEMEICDRLGTSVEPAYEHV